MELCSRARPEPPPTPPPPLLLLQLYQPLATLAESRFHFRRGPVSGSPAVPPVMRKSMASLSRILKPKLLLMPSESECSIQRETRSGGACLLLSVHKRVRRAFCCQHRLLPPPPNPSSAGDRKIRNDQTQTRFLISFQSPGRCGKSYSPRCHPTCSPAYREIFPGPQKHVLFCSRAWPP